MEKRTWVGCSQQLQCRMDPEEEFKHQQNLCNHILYIIHPHGHK
ncbi:rCG24818 [Rattus norvegicus]|uniref:RCG24818 n=1 Tax=Rattus norvegicus TaxID=10116 RepID=A6JBI5_RAT|nr:rCG24818 [Rattus norvegicus]